MEVGVFGFSVLTRCKSDSFVVLCWQRKSTTTCRRGGLAGDDDGDGDAPRHGSKLSVCFIARASL